MESKAALHHSWTYIWWRESLDNEQIARRAAIVLVNKPVKK